MDNEYGKARINLLVVVRMKYVLRIAPDRYSGAGRCPH